MEIVIPDELYELIVEIDKRIDIDNELTQLAEEASELARLHPDSILALSHFKLILNTALKPADIIEVKKIT